MNNTWNFLFLYFKIFALSILKPDRMDQKKMFLVFCIICLSFCSFAQGGLAGTLIQGATSMEGSSDYVLSKKLHSAGNYKGNIRGPGDPLYFGVNGTPYFVNTFLEGEIILRDGSSLTNVLLLYDNYNDITFILSNNDTLALDKKKVKAFTLKDKNRGKTYYFELLSPEQEKSGKDDLHFFEAAYNGKTGLFISHYKELILANFDPTFYTGSNYDEYVDNNIYYIKYQQGEMRRIKLNRKSILEALKNKKSEIKEFVTENSLSFDTEQNVKRIFEFYDSLK